MCNLSEVVLLSRSELASAPATERARAGADPHIVKLPFVSPRTGGRPGSVSDTGLFPRQRAGGRGARGCEVNVRPFERNSLRLQRRRKHIDAAPALLGSLAGHPGPAADVSPAGTRMPGQRHGCVEAQLGLGGRSVGRRAPCLDD